jgi:hypothetical protein
VPTVSADPTATGSVPSQPHRFLSLPGSALGWWGIGLTAAILPVAYVLMTHMIPWPILDTAVAPVILVALIDAAAIVGVLAVRRARERSVLTIAALVVALPLALFATLMLLLEAAFPH